MVGFLTVNQPFLHDHEQPRRARPVEAEDVGRLYLAARRHAVSAIPPPAHPDAAVIAWMAARVRGGDDVWVTDDADGVSALLVLEPGWVDQLYVRPDATGTGLGAALLAHAKAEQPHGLQLWTFQTNAGARRFYERHGFVAVELTDGNGNEEKAPDVRYVWRP
jgi:GNAT superfamily N-acetyltransferase